MFKRQGNDEATLLPEESGTYELIKGLCQHFASRLPNPSSHEKQFLRKSFEILLHKGTARPEGLPEDWESEDVLNGIRHDIYRRCLVKKTWNDVFIKKLKNHWEFLRNQSESEYYKNVVDPTLRMLLCLEYLQQRPPSPPKEERFFDRFFDLSIIDRRIDYYKKLHRSPEVTKWDQFFTLPPRITQSHRDGNLKNFPTNNTFDFVFGLGKPSYDLDEGFVTPNDDHIEESPVEPKQFAVIEEVQPQKKFSWDSIPFEVLSAPPSRHRTHEKYGTIGRLVVQPPFLFPASGGTLDPRETQQVISRKQFMDDLLCLLLGIRSSTFIFDGEKFHLSPGLRTTDLKAPAVLRLSKKFLATGNAYIRLENFSKRSSNALDEDVISFAFELALKEYLYKCQMKVIDAKDEYSTKETSYMHIVAELDPLMDQILFLNETFTNKGDLKGDSLLKYLYDLMFDSANHQFYRVISLLFLRPCNYYFRLIDDWIFVGRWGKGLSLLPTDMSLVRDRASWLDAYKSTGPSPPQPGSAPRPAGGAEHLSCRTPDQSPSLFAVSNLSHLGKAVYLLSQFERYERLIELFKSDERPKLKMCLNLDELRELREKCEEFYVKGLESLVSNEEVSSVDLALIAENAAQSRIEEFERRKQLARLEVQERKKAELKLREDDLVRSAENREARRLEDVAIDRRVALEQDIIQQRRLVQELELEKALMERHNEELRIEEKKTLLTEWKLKRLKLNEKRKAFLTADAENLLAPLPTNIDKIVITKPLEEFNNVEPESQRTTDNFITENIISDSDNNILSDIPTVVVTENLDNRNLDTSNNNPTEIEANGLSDLEKNKNKVLGSDFLSEPLMMDIVRYDDDIITDRERNKRKILGSNIDEGNATESSRPQESPSSDRVSNSVFMEEEPRDDNYIHSKGSRTLSDLEINRNKIMGSDWNKGDEVKLHIWDAENQKNRNHILGSHFTFHMDETSIRSVDSKTLKPESINAIIIKDKVKVIDNVVSDITAKKEDKSLKLTKKSSWFLVEKVIDERINKIFEIKRPSLTYENKDMDFILLHKLYTQSLNAVINVQTRLVNKALLDLFMEELKLLQVAQKLREYFFLHGDFGKQLTSLLSKAVELEEPSSLLTFHRLRRILTEATRGNVRELSFSVTNPPPAFRRNSSKVLSCLGLTYKIDWPLNLILTPDAILKYNLIFVYLLSLRRVSWHLEEMSHIIHFKPPDLKGFQYTQIQLYRFVMSKFVDAFLSYIVTSVIETNWENFSKDLQQVKDIDELYKRHAMYIKMIRFQCFLDNRSWKFMVQIEQALGKVLMFCRVLRYGEWSWDPVANEYTHSNFNKLRDTFSSFTTWARTITKNIKKLVVANYQNEVENLYNYLTINSFFIS